MGKQIEYSNGELTMATGTLPACRNLRKDTA